MQVHLEVPIHFFQFLHLQGILLGTCETSAVVPAREGVLGRGAWVASSPRKEAWTLYFLAWEDGNTQVPLQRGLG